MVARRQRGAAGLRLSARPRCSGSRWETLFSNKAAAARQREAVGVRQRRRVSLGALPFVMRSLRSPAFRPGQELASLGDYQLPEGRTYDSGAESVRGGVASNSDSSIINRPTRERA